MKKLYYISQGEQPQDHLHNIKQALVGGVKLVQLRLKNVSQEVYNATALKAKEICLEFEAQLIVNDNLHAAHFAQADGLHLGKTDMPPAEARKHFKGIIGGTANTLADCERLIAANVNYIGLGPYQFTKTKTNLDPVLGLSGYESILNKISSKDVPIYAIGNIGPTDVQPLLDIGIHGVCMSGALTGSNLSQTTNELKGII